MAQTSSGRRLFGTDGIRGVANVDLHPKLAYDLGRATAAQLVGAGGSLLIGQDTRRSGDMLAASVAAREKWTWTAAAERIKKRLGEISSR